MLTYRDHATGEIMVQNHVTGESEWLKEFNRKADEEIAKTRALTAEMQAFRASQFTSELARSTQAPAVCPACEAGDHGNDAYSIAFACECKCHKGEVTK